MKERVLVPSDLRKSKDVDRKLDRFMREYDKFEEREAVVASARRRLERPSANQRHPSPQQTRGFAYLRADDFNPRFVKIDSGLSDAGTDNRMVASHANDSLVLEKPVKAAPVSTVVTSLNKRPVPKTDSKQTAKLKPLQPSDEKGKQKKYTEAKHEESQLSISSSGTKFLLEDKHKATAGHKKQSAEQQRGNETGPDTVSAKAKGTEELNGPRYIKVQVDGGQNVYLTRSEYLAYNLASRAATGNEKEAREEPAAPGFRTRHHSLHKKSEPNVELISKSRNSRSRKTEFDRSSEFDGSRVTAKPFTQLRKKQVSHHRSIETQTDDTKPSHRESLPETPHVAVQASTQQEPEKPPSLRIKKKFEMGTQTNRSTSVYWESSDRDVRKPRQQDKMIRTGKSIEQVAPPVVIEKVTLPSINKYSQPK